MNMNVGLVGKRAKTVGAKAAPLFGRRRPQFKQSDTVADSAGGHGGPQPMSDAARGTAIGDADYLAVANFASEQLPQTQG
jgi:hypothetical protein